MWRLWRLVCRGQQTSYLTRGDVGKRGKVEANLNLHHRILRTLFFLLCHRVCQCHYTVCHHTPPSLQLGLTLPFSSCPVGSLREFATGWENAEKIRFIFGLQSDSSTTPSRCLRNKHWGSTLPCFMFPLLKTSVFKIVNICVYTDIIGVWVLICT